MMGYMGWEGFMRTEREQLRQRREGKLRRALGFSLAGETAEQLDRIGERDRRLLLLGSRRNGQLPLQMIARHGLDAN
jgi:hypothetical protein